MAVQEFAPKSAAIAVELLANHVALVEIQRPPNNYFDIPLIEDLSDAFRALEGRGDIRSIVLASQGKHFCAGADFGGGSGAGEVSADEGARALYAAAASLFDNRIPIVAAVQGAAIGGGLGLALAADFRVASEESSFAASFAKLGLHHGFGLSVTLPRVVGSQRAAQLLLTGNRIAGREAFRIGLVDRIVDADLIRSMAIAFAEEVSAAAPLAVQSIRATLRKGLVDEIRSATDHERSEQHWLRATSDFGEGVQATAQRRTPVFLGQ